MSLGTADVLVRAKTGQYKKDLKKAEERIIQFGKRATASVAKVGASFASIAGVAGIGGLAIATIKSGAQFEKQMATVRGVMRATEKDYELLKNAAKLMGEKTEWSAKQSAEALQYMGMAGYTAQQAVAALPGVLNLASAAGMDLGRAADIVTDSITAMGMGVNDLSRFNDVLIGTTTRSNTNIEMMGESLKYVAPIAAQYGYEIESLSAMIGTLANAGIKASDAGTDLRQAMVRNAKAAKTLGTAETDLIGTLKAAKKAGWGVNEVTEHYGMIASKSVLVLMDQIEAFERLEKQLHNVEGETKKLAETKLDNLEGDFKILLSTIESVGQAAYDHIKGDLRKGVQDFTKFVRDNKDKIVAFTEDLKKTAIYLGKVAKALSGVLKVAIDGFTALPPVVREIGLVGLIVGGVKGRLAIAGTIAVLGAAKGYIDDLVDSADGISQAFTPGKMPESLEDLEKHLKKLTNLKSEYLDLNATGQKTKGGSLYLENLQDQIIEAQDKIEDLKEGMQNASEAAKNINLSDMWLARDKGAPTRQQEQAMVQAAIKAADEQIKIKSDLSEKVRKLSHTEAEEQRWQLEQKKAEIEAKYGDNGEIMSLFNQYYAKRTEQIAELEKQSKKTFSPTSIKTTEIDAAQNYIDMLKQQSEMFDMTEKEAALYRMQIMGASEDQLTLAGSILTTIDKQKKQAEAEREGKQVKEAIRTAQERYNDELERLNKLLKADAIDQDEFNRAKKQAKKDLDDATESQESFGEALKDSLKGWGGQWSSMMTDMLWGAETTFGDILESFGKMLTQMALKKLAVEPIISGISSFIPSAKGNVFTGPGIEAYENQVVSSPTWFAFANGAGVMGEEYKPEGILPLRRMRNGDLGVQSEMGQTSTQVNVNIYEAQGTKATVERSQDGQSLNVIIERVEGAIASRMSRGSGLAGYLDSRYGRRC